MSLKVKSINQPRSYVSSRSFSSSSMGSYSIPRFGTGTYQGASVTPVTFNKSLLTPLKLDIDPAVQAVRTQEKEQIKTLNNQFISFIEKVRFLEQQNKMLETKWELLQGQTAANSTIEPMLKFYIANLQKHLESLNNDKKKHDLENTAIHEKVDEYKTKYEQEINRKNDAENDFVLLKKDMDASYLSRMDLQERASVLSDELLFLRALYDEELHELQESMKTSSAVVEMDNSRDLNMDHIIAEVKAQYEDVAARSRNEAESWYKAKFDHMAAEADQYNTELGSTKGQISELTRSIRRLENDLTIVKAQSNSLQAQAAEAEQHGEEAVQDAKAHIRNVEEALQRAKQDMARQIREYQDLMNVKLALDIEISTYKKLLEGEEERLGHNSYVSVKRVPTKTAAQNHSQRKSGAVVIKTVETKDILYSESRKHTAVL